MLEYTKFVKSGDFRAVQSTKGVGEGKASAESVEKIKSAINIYEEIYKTDPGFLMCRIKLAVAYAEYANATNDANSIKKAKDFYNSVANDIGTRLRSSMSTTEIFQWNALADLMNNYGYI